MLWARRAGVLITAMVVLAVGWFLANAADQVGLMALTLLVRSLVIVIVLLIGGLGWWWVSVLWLKSICLVTTQRLTKFIYTTPFNRHNLSLPLDMIVDTGSYTKGFLPALFRLGTFTARSAAASSGIASDEDEFATGKRLNRKYFFIENLAIAEDLQHYINKLLNAYKHHRDYLPSFRPFIPHLKGQAREDFMKQYPEYWS